MAKIPTVTWENSTINIVYWCNEHSKLQIHREEVTRENNKFIQEVIESKWGPREVGLGMTNHNSPLKVQPIEPQLEWTENSTRTGVIAKKIGIYPMWLKNGKKVLATLLQVTSKSMKSTCLLFSILPSLNFTKCWTLYISGFWEPQK